jgi:hypothetical protein
MFDQSLWAPRHVLSLSKQSGVHDAMRRGFAFPADDQILKLTLQRQLIVRQYRKTL